MSRADDRLDRSRPAYCPGNGRSSSSSAHLCAAVVDELGDGRDRYSSRDLVFSMHDVEELGKLIRSAGFREVDVQAKPKDLRLPAPEDFLWQYIRSTPLAEAAAQADTRKLDELERDVCARWQEFAADGSLSGQVGMTTGSAVK